jgi:hypothetical protein
MQIPYIIVAAILVSFVLVHVNQRLASPVIAIADRWLRWIIFPIVGAWLCRDFELIDRPMWVMAVAGFSSGSWSRRSTTGWRSRRSA